MGNRPERGGEPRQQPNEQHVAPKRKIYSHSVESPMLVLGNSGNNILRRLHLAKKSCAGWKIEINFTTVRLESLSAVVDVDVNMLGINKYECGGESGL